MRTRTRASEQRLSTKTICTLFVVLLRELALTLFEDSRVIEEQMQIGLMCVCVCVSFLGHLGILLS